MTAKQDSVLELWLIARTSARVASATRKNAETYLKECEVALKIAKAAEDVAVADVAAKTAEVANMLGTPIKVEGLLVEAVAVK